MIVASGRPTTPAGPHEEPLLEQRRSPPPLPRPAPSRMERGAAGGFALLGCLVFAVAAILSPYDTEGRPLSYGTHRQLGLPPCAMQALTGISCPSCGMTTSISLVMHGDLVAASEANWAGLIVAGLGLVATVWLATVAAGIHAGVFTVDETIKWLTVAGTTVAMLRWLGLVATWLGQ